MSVQPILCTPGQKAETHFPLIIQLLAFALVPGKKARPCLERKQSDGCIQEDHGSKEGQATARSLFWLRFSSGCVPVETIRRTDLWHAGGGWRASSRRDVWAWLWKRASWDRGRWEEKRKRSGQVGEECNRCSQLPSRLSSFSPAVSHGSLGDKERFACAWSRAAPFSTQRTRAVSDDRGEQIPLRQRILKVVPKINRNGTTLDRAEIGQPPGPPFAHNGSVARVATFLVNFWAVGH